MSETDEGRARRALSTIVSTWDATWQPPRPVGAPGHSAPAPRPPAGWAFIRANTANVLAYWAQALAEEAPGTLPKYRLDLGNVIAVAGYLDDNLKTVAAWTDSLGRSYLAQFATEAAELAADLDRLVNPPDDAKLIGPCHLANTGEQLHDAQHRDPDHAAPCTGKVYAAPEPDTDGLDAYQYATCNRCGSVALISWWRKQWRLEGEQLLTTAELAKHLGKQGIKVEPATIRWWLHKGRIYASGTADDGHRLYDPTAVTMALALTPERSTTA